MPKNSGKDRGSLTQKADNQQVRISQVSNVSKTVSAMGKKTTKEMNETERRISSGGDSGAIAGSMNSVLGSLKNTIDSLERGVEAATLGTAKAATEAFKQYGSAISEDIKINKQNMVASALSSSTPIFGYFASKFMETGIFKQTTEKMKNSISNIFERKSKGGSIPDDFGGDGGNGGPGSMAKSAAAAKQDAVRTKKDSIDTLKIVNKDKREKYDKPFEKRQITALVAIQNVLGGQLGKFDQWYNKFLLEHPFFRISMTAAKATAATFSGAWTAVYFFWKKRGGYAKYMSKAKRPLDAINQNIAQTFVQMMPRLDAIMIYTKATAIAIRDLSAHVTGIKYGRMDPAKMAGTWSIAGTTMKIIRAIGSGMKKGAMWGVEKITKKGSKPNQVLAEIVNTLGLMASGVDLAVTGPGRLKKKISMSKAASKERERVMGGLGEVGGKSKGGIDKQECIGVYICDKQKKKKEKQDKLILTGKKKEEKKKLKFDKKMMGYTAKSAKAAMAMNKRQKRKGVWDMIKSVFGGIGSIFSTAMSFLGPITKGITSFISGLFAKGGMIFAGVASLFSKMGPILAALTSSWFWGPILAAFGGYKIGDWVNTNIIKPHIMDPYFKKNETSQKKGERTATEIRKEMQEQAKTGKGKKAWEGRMGLKATDLIKTQSTLIGGSLSPAAIRAGQMSVIQKNQSIYAKYSIDELEKARTRWRHSFGYGMHYKMMSQGDDPEKFGVEKEQHFLKYLAKVGTPMKDEEYKAAVEGQQASIRRAAANAEAKKKGIKTLGTAEAEKWAREKGGEATEYFGKTYDRALEISKKYATAVKNKTVAVATLSWEKAKELEAKYGLPAKQFMTMTLTQATKYGLEYRAKLSEGARKTIDTLKAVKDSATVSIEETYAMAKKYGGKPMDYINLNKEQAEKYGSEILDKGRKAVGTGRTWLYKQKVGAQNQLEKLKQWDKEKGISEGVLKKSGEYIEIGKGTFLEIYRESKSKLTEMYANASPDKKQMIKQKIEGMLASGEITAKQLKEMGINLKDATMEGAKKIGDSVQSTAVYTANNISNSVSNMSGGDGGTSQKMLQEQTMDDIAMGAMN